MKNPAILAITVFAVLLTANFRLVSAAETPATNPIIWADVPDIAIVRVSDTYYMSSTTMHMAPGVPVMKSKNLVDWETVSYTYDILEDIDALALRNGKNAYGAGTWASSFRHHDGVFYLSTFAGTTGKTHIYSTRDIVNEPWREVSFKPMLHDHTLFFDDDGRVYMLTGVGNLRLVELEKDLTGLKPGGFDEIVIRNTERVAGGLPGLRGEGSQMFKHDGKYYVCVISWPKGDMRMELIFRADKITGPYEGRVILKDSGIAQGSLIDTPDGKWYAYMFQDAGAVGRIPFIIPVTWEDGWPVLGTDGKVPTTLDIPREGDGLANIVASDEFDRDAAILEKLASLPKEENRYLREAFPPAWQWNHNPDNRFWSLTERPGWLRLTAGRVDKNLPDARNMLTQRTFGPTCTAETCVDVSGMKDGDYAGLAAFQKKYGCVGVVISNGRMFVEMEIAGLEVMKEPLQDGDRVYLKIECDFRDLKDEANFFYSTNGEEWTQVGRTLKMEYTLPHFMGYRFGLFHFATKRTGGYADFDYYRISKGE